MNTERVVAITLLLVVIAIFIHASLKKLGVFQKWDTVRDWFKLYKDIKALPLHLQRDIYRKSIKGKYGKILGIEPGQYGPPVPRWASKPTPETGFIRIREASELLNHVGKLVRVVKVSSTNVMVSVGHIIGETPFLRVNPMNATLRDDVPFRHVQIRHNAGFVRINEQGIDEKTLTENEELFKWNLITPYDTGMQPVKTMRELIPEEEFNRQMQLVTELEHEVKRNSFIPVDAPNSLNTMIQSIPISMNYNLVETYPNHTISDYYNGIFLVDVVENSRPISLS